MEPRCGPLRVATSAVETGLVDVDRFALMVIIWIGVGSLNDPTFGVNPYEIFGF